MQHEQPLAKAVFFGLIHPKAAPSLQLDGCVNWAKKQLDLPERFLVPLAGLDGEPIGYIEFKLLTILRQQARYAAMQLHQAHSEDLPSIPRLPLLSPLPPAAL